MSGITLIDDKQDGRPYGTTREAFLAINADSAVADWLSSVEGTYGLLERIARIGMKDGRILILGRFANAWMINLYNPGNEPTYQELQCFLSFEAMIAFWGLHEYLTTRQTNEQAWDAFMNAIDKDNAKRGDAT